MATLRSNNDGTWQAVIIDVQRGDKAYLIRVLVQNGRTQAILDFQHEAPTLIWLRAEIMAALVKSDIDRGIPAWLAPGTLIDLYKEPV